MSGALKRNADEILEALEAGAQKFKRALGQRQRDSAQGIRDRRRAVEQQDGDMGTDLTARQTDLTSGPVRELDVGTYRDLRNRQVSGDRMQHDHIPSQAAMIEARRRELQRDLTPEELADIRDNSLSIELRNELHYASRTYGGNNNAAQISRDADNLLVAANRDIDTLQQNLIDLGEYDIDTIDAVIDQMRDLVQLRWG